MKFSKLSLGLVAVGLAAAPAIAQVASTPAVAPLSGDENGIEAEGVILGLLGAAAVVGAIIVAADSDDTELPVSG